MRASRHSPAFKEQALAKARDRGNRTLGDVARELNMSLGTLKGWLKGPGLAATQWSVEQRLQALCVTHGMSGPALAAWCREQGLFEHQLQQWRRAFCTPASASSEAGARHSQVQLRELQAHNASLQRDLRRKDRALRTSHVPANKFSQAEQQAAMQAMSSSMFKDLPPCQIVPRLADMGAYVGSESTL